MVSPHRQLLGGPGWEGHLPHVPTAEGQEDGRPPSSPLCLLQQDRTFCGECLRVLGHGTMGEEGRGIFREQGPGQQGQAGRGRSAGTAQRREPPAGQSRPCSSLLCAVGSLPREGRELAGRFVSPLPFLPRSKRSLASSCRKTWPLMTSCSWTPGTRWVKDTRQRLSGPEGVGGPRLPAPR